VPELTVDQLTLALAIVAGVALLSFLIVLVLALRIKKLRRDYAILRGEGDERDVFAAVSRALKRVDGVDRRLDGIVASQAEAQAVNRYALSRFGLVRYDAFEEMGGRLSFSAAFLDEHGDGLVFSSINGRTETRTYAKPIKGLASDHTLSPEERSAIEEALSGSQRSEPVAAGGPSIDELQAEVADVETPVSEKTG
jgi:Protein of unknown function (DUF4446)